MKGFLSIITWISVTVTAGCITTLDVDPVAPGGDASGLVYSMPKTYLVVKQNADGTIKAEFEFHPDPTRQYAISAQSIFATHTLDIQLSASGLLKSVQWDPNSTAVAKSVIDAGNEIAKQVLAAREAEKEKEKTDAGAKKAKREEALKTARTAVTTAESGVETAKRAVEQLESDRRVLEFRLSQNLPETEQTATQIRSLRLQHFQKDELLRFARTDLSNAEGKLTIANGKLAEFTADDSDATATAENTPTPAALNRAGGGGDGDPSYESEWAPVLFEIIEGVAPESLEPGVPIPWDTLEAGPYLQAVSTDDGFGQQRFATGSVPKKARLTTAPRLSIVGGNELTSPTATTAVFTAIDSAERARRMLEFAKQDEDNDEAVRSAEKTLLDRTLACNESIAAARRAGLELRVDIEPAPSRFEEEHALFFDGTEIKVAGVALSKRQLIIDLPDDLVEGVYGLVVGSYRKTGDQEKLIESKVRFRLRGRPQACPEIDLRSAMLLR